MNLEKSEDTDMSCSALGHQSASERRPPQDADPPGEGVVEDEGIFPGISDFQLPLDRLFMRVAASQRNQDLSRTNCPLFSSIVHFVFIHLVSGYEGKEVIVHS